MDVVRNGGNDDQNVNLNILLMQTERGKKSREKKQKRIIGGMNVCFAQTAKRSILKVSGIVTIVGIS